MDPKYKKNTKRVPLSSAELFWHYSIVFFFLIIPSITSWNYIQYYLLESYEGVRTPRELSISYILVIPAIIFYLLQKKRLKYSVCEITVTEVVFKEAFEKTARELNWSVEKYSGNFIRAHRKWEWSNSWGELITIKRQKDKILVNSICDPNAIFISVTSYGWNKKNVRTFLSNLKQLNSALSQ